MFGLRLPSPPKADACAALESDCWTSTADASCFDWLREPPPPSLKRRLSSWGTSGCNSFDGKGVGIATIQASGDCSAVFDDGDDAAIVGDEWSEESLSDALVAVAWRGGGGTRATEPCC